MDAKRVREPVVCKWGSSVRSRLAPPNLSRSSPETKVTFWPERIFERFEHPSLQIEVPQIIIHKADQPDVVVDFETSLKSVKVAKLTENPPCEVCPGQKLLFRLIPRLPGATGFS
jgi:hypothetical protein